MSKIVLVGGTWSYDTDPGPDEWYHPFSEFSEWLRDHGVIHAENEPFVWSGRLDGILGNDVDWHAAADNLAYRLKQYPVWDRNILCHSHGGSVGILAAKKLERHGGINKLVTAGTPVRKKNHEIGYAAMRMGIIRGWWHLYSPGRFSADKMQWLGSLFDGKWGVERRFLIPGVQNVGVKGIDHSRALHEKAIFDKAIAESGIAAFLRGEGMGV